MHTKEQKQKTMEYTNYEIRHASHPADFKAYETMRLRGEFLIQNLFEKDRINLVYSDYDRFIVGGILPVSVPLELKAIEPLKAVHFLDRRELGIINIGETAVITVEGKRLELGHKEALYLGKNHKSLVFESLNPGKPARLYMNSAPAHKEFPDKKITLSEAEIVETGDSSTANARTINKLIVNSLVETCQLQMGLTSFKTGSVWNTMPVHTHDRRMEAYFYFEVPENQAICHFMGKPDETRHIWVHNEEAVISPNWSLHSGVGTAQYSFIWGMAGENLNYGDMDVVLPHELK
jgi:4-deoxy-L-threo-5-hexosulose-uronate ketol-isomerase